MRSPVVRPCGAVVVSRSALLSMLASVPSDTDTGEPCRASMSTVPAVTTVGRAALESTVAATVGVTVAWPRIMPKSRPSDSPVRCAFESPSVMLLARTDIVPVTVTVEPSPTRAVTVGATSDAAKLKPMLPRPEMSVESLSLSAWSMPSDCTSSVPAVTLAPGPIDDLLLPEATARVLSRPMPTRLTLSARPTALDWLMPSARTLTAPATLNTAPALTAAATSAVLVAVASEALAVARPTAGASAVAKAPRMSPPRTWWIACIVSGSTFCPAAMVTLSAVMAPPASADTVASRLERARLRPAASPPTLRPKTSVSALWSVPASTLIAPLLLMRLPAPMVARTSGVMSA